MTSENEKTMDTVTKVMVNNHVKHLYNFLKEKRELFTMLISKEKQTNLGG